VAEESDRIRNQIEYTRAELAHDVERLADKTSPRRVAQRRWTAVKEKVMGTPRHAAYTNADTVRSAADTVQDAAARAGDKAGDAAHQVADTVTDTVRQAPEKVARQTQGNPIAAGVIAFGVGLLAASLIPTTDVERQAGQQLRDNAGDLADRVRQPLRESAQQLRTDVSGSIREAADQVKETARDAAATTTQEAKSSARYAAEETHQATRDAT
jgi:gas vesicle protein